MKKCDFSKLLEETPETYYWIGFILADAHISNNTRIKITLARKDKDHLIKLQKFLNIKTIKEDSQVSISGMDSKIVRKFCQKFKVVSNKTKYPPDLSKITNSDLLTALKIGFIDGDGCIGFQFRRKDCILRIKCYSNWKDNLEFLFGKCKINNQGYAVTTIASSNALKDLKKVALDLNLPIMNRKWDKIDLSSNSKYDIAKERVKIVKEKLLLGWNQKQISKFLKMSNSGVSLLILRNNLKNE